MDEAKKIDIDELFGGEFVFTQVLKGYDVRFRFRELDAKTDIEFQRRSIKTQNRNGKVEQTEESLTADCWLFDQLCKSVEVVVDDMVEAVTDFKTKLAPDVKRTALFHFRQRITKKDDAGN